VEEQLWVRANTVEVCESVGDNNTIRHLSTKRQTYMFGGTRLFGNSYNEVGEIFTKYGTREVVIP
jgi:hypothetical protein